MIGGLPCIVMALHMRSTVMISAPTINNSGECSPLKRYLYTSFLFFFGMSMVSGVGVFPRRLKANSTPGEQPLTCSTAAHPSRPPHEHGAMHAAQSWATS